MMSLDAQLWGLLDDSSVYASPKRPRKVQANDLRQKLAPRQASNSVVQCEVGKLKNFEV